ERFSYYGMRAVLVLYFKFFLHWDDNLSTAIYHTFVALCYLTPILGALIADSWLGKFKTIISLSIVYTVGQVVLSISSINDLMDGNHDGAPDDVNIPIAFSMIGLVLIALGTGGIKPCVAAFGGDQFEEDQEKQRSRFFSIFYLSINAGSLLSTIITPILRGVECGIHDKQKCYPLAFGVPAALMAIALFVFVIGSRMYKKVKPEGNIMVQVGKSILFAIRNRFKHRSKQFPKREHWLDWATEKYDKRLITEIKMVLKVLFLYIPLPMFWALFDQQVNCEKKLLTVNPILIVVMVPVVDVIIYPLIKKYIQANTISMAWQIPQYFIMTCAEVVFSVTGLEFSYSQAPTNMKSVLQAGWLLTVAFGNIIVLIIAGASKLEEQWAEYILFAALLFAVTIVFAVMAYFYTYVDPAEVEAQFAEEDKKKKEKDQLEKKKHIYENEAGSELQTKM
uniref:Solute carrier family 15 member 1 n=1 Tax=Pseudonaja textilis TaxID=8673 RepID=A0A670YXG5_PSETE